jgi:AI-2 transport protein TqsA
VVDTPNTSRGLTGLLTIAALVLIGAGLRATAPIAVPLLLALFFAIIASPPISRLHRLGVPVALAILMVTGAFLGVGALLSGVVAVSLGDLSASLPAYQARIDAMGVSASDWVASRGFEFEIEDLKRLIDPSAAVSVAGQFLSRLGAILTNGVLVGFLMIFILLEATSVPAKLAAMTSNHERAQRTLEQMREQVDAYFGVLTIVSAATALLVYLILLLVGVDLAVLWALLAFLLNYIPNVGSIIAAVPPVLLALVQLGPGSAGVVMLGYVAVNMVVGNIIQPRLMGRDLGLSTLTVFVSLLFWGWLLGPVGMLVSVPLTSAIRLVLEANESTRPIAVILGTEDAARRITEDDPAEAPPA